MSAIKDGRLPIVLDKERHLLISLNVIDEIQTKFGSFNRIDELIAGQDGIKSLRWLLTIMLNEGKEDDEPDLTEKEVGKMIHTGNMGEVKNSIYRAFGLAIQGKEEMDKSEENTDDEEQSPNEIPDKVIT